MKRVEIFLFCLIVVTSIFTNFSSLMGLELFSYASAVPLFLFLALLGYYNSTIEKSRHKVLLYVYLALSIFSYLFVLFDWSGKLLLEVSKEVTVLAVSILWISKFNDRNQSKYNKKLKWISILFLGFLITQVISIKLSIVLFIGLAVLIIPKLKGTHPNKSDDEDDLKLLKIIFLISIYLLFSRLSPTLLTVV